MSWRFPGLLSLALVASLASPGSGRAQETPSAAADAVIETAPVQIDGTTLFRVRGASSFPAAMRARLIEDQIAKVASESAIAIDSLRAVEDGDLTRIRAGNMPIMSVVDADASLEQVRRAVLAEAHLIRIRQAVADYRAARSPTAIWRSAFNLVGATLAFGVAIAALLLFWRWVERVIRRRFQARIRSVEVQSFELMRAEQVWAAFDSLLFALRTIVFLAVALVYLGFALGQFPWTRGLSRDLMAFVLGPLKVMGQGIAAHLPSLVFLTVLFVIVRLVLRVIRLFFDGVGRGTITLAGFDQDWAEPTYKIVRLAIVAFALVVAFPYIPGSDTDAFKGVSLFIGIVFSLGSSSAISNMIAGYMLTYRRAMKVGDRVKIGDAFGDVIETRLQVTHLRSVKNEEIIIPNSQILAGEVVNYSSLARADGLILHTEVGIGYETPWRQVEAMLLTAADRTDGVSKQPRPFVQLKKLGDFAVTYELNAYCTDVPAMNRLYAELHRHILDVFNEYGVQIMTPAYEGDPAIPKVVPRKDWYAAPASEPR